MANQTESKVRSGIASLYLTFFVCFCWESIQDVSVLEGISVAFHLYVSLVDIGVLPEGWNGLITDHDIDGMMKCYVMYGGAELTHEA